MTDTTPAAPQRRRHLRRAGLLSTALVAGFLGLALPAEADESSLPIRGSAYTGTAPVSQCTSEFKEEYRYPTEGYRIGASCSSLADWTEARGVSNWPTHAYNATEWFGYKEREYWSDFKAQIRLPVGTLHPRDTEVEYRPAGSGIRIWTGAVPASPDLDRQVSVTLPPDASGTVAVYWEQLGGPHVKLDEGSIANGRADLRVPAGAVDAGFNQQVYATFRGDDRYPAMRTPSGGISVEKPTARPALDASYTHVPTGKDVELTVSLPRAEGPVAVMEGDRTVGTIEMRGGRGILTTSLPEGEHTLRAVHPGNNRFLPGESAPLTLTVFEPRIEVESATLQPGETLRATATFPTAATGRVQFLLTWPGSMGGIGTAEIVDGKATFSIPVDRIGTGTFGLAADHRGANGVMPSRSEPVSITIGGAAATAAAAEEDPVVESPEESTTEESTAEEPVTVDEPSSTPETAGQE